MFKNISLILFLLISSLSLWAQEQELVDAAKISIESLKKSDIAPSAQDDCVVDKTITHSSLKAHNGKDFEISEISYEYLEELFKWLAQQKDIPFKYPEDGCYARAQAMARLLEMKGIISGKTFIEGDLRVETQNSPKGYVEWWYHVAPIVKVKKDGKEMVYVIDPSIFDRPVTVEEWYHIQTKHQNGRADETYYTQRFNYEPFEKDENLKDYKKEDLEDAKDILNQYTRVLQQRQKAKQ